MIQPLRKRRSIVFLFLVLTLLSSLSTFVFVGGNLNTAFAKKHSGDSGSGGSDGGGGNNDGQTDGQTGSNPPSDNNNPPVAPDNTGSTKAQGTQCAIGEHFDDKENKCVKDTTTLAGDQQQPQGFVGSDVLQNKVPGLGCGKDEHFDGGKCVSDNVPLSSGGCAPGRHLDTTSAFGSCIKNIDKISISEAGLPFKLGCGKDGHFDSNKGQCVDNRIPLPNAGCVPGYHRIPFKCAPDSEPYNGVCVAGYHLDTTSFDPVCVKNTLTKRTTTPPTQGTDNTGCTGREKDTKSCP